jgi:hypothetical protein
MWYTACSITGMVLFTLSLFKLKESLTFLKTSERAAATVVELETVRGSDGIGGGYYLAQQVLR